MTRKKQYGIRADEWEVKHFLSAVDLYKMLTESILEHSANTLLSGDLLDFQEISTEFREDFASFIGGIDEDQFERYMHTVRVITDVGAGILGAYKLFMEDAAAARSLPDPDTVEIPDSADDIDW